jgi:hypothetical protein
VKSILAFIGGLVVFGVLVGIFASAGQHPGATTTGVIGNSGTFQLVVNSECNWAVKVTVSEPS